MTKIITSISTSSLHNNNKLKKKKTMSKTIEYYEIR